MAHWASYIAFGFEEEEFQKLLLELKDKLSQYNDNIAWHNPDYMHMTLQFLGWTRDSDIEKLRQILQNEKIEDINFKLNGKLVLLGFDAQKEYIAMEVAPTKELLQYREELEKKMQEYGVPFKKTGFFKSHFIGQSSSLRTNRKQRIF